MKKKIITIENQQNFQDALRYNAVKLVIFRFVLMSQTSFYCYVNVGFDGHQTYKEMKVFFFPLFYLFVAGLTFTKLVQDSTNYIKVQVHAYNFYVHELC